MNPRYNQKSDPTKNSNARENAQIILYKSSRINFQKESLMILCNYFSELDCYWRSYKCFLNVKWNTVTIWLWLKGKWELIRFQIGILQINSCYYLFYYISFIRIHIYENIVYEWCNKPEVKQNGKILAVNMLDCSFLG